jgi:uncharacterized protein YdhG (YjbR/CyaY superfamily)
MKMIEAANIDEYISQFPAGTQKLLKQMRATIKKAAPGAKEAMKYGIPTFVLEGRNLVHFGGYNHHVGFYPTPNGMQTFKEELAPYAQGKGSANFPLDKPMPLGLVTKIVKYRIKVEKEQQAKGKTKRK